ncbi:unnamed protein product [Rotaria socialis]|uniref:NAD(P)(+)--arginine ADP-ribosyltransferase n=1 Tax=Rotaria socialis TaxID=392032 RepID=A0A818R7E5_9BILA|nr:unnamed protein product [Rotaria socialis]CAF3541440.1 unnamed protein product [Rotaria socialis]CAF3647095.1 unnamed protein product [Rotaria socialis]CAF4223587.1 unnamed protein product [Rotaria socialis]CAF4263938.1 unnamed protein product [Rotaria socialis]
MTETSESQYNSKKFVVIWLDTNTNLTNYSADMLAKHARGMIGSVLTFNDADQCIDLITDVEDVHIFFIISESLSINIVPLIYQIQQIHAIYIYSLNANQPEQCLKQYRKVHGIYSDIHSISHQLNKDILQLLRDFISTHILPSIYDKNDDNKLPVSIVYSQILRDILIQMDDCEIAKQEMVELLRKHSMTNIEELKLIDEFDLNYRPASAVWWYTRPCFLHKMLNDALRRQDIDVLYKFRCFIKDLHELLAHFQLSMWKKLKSNTCYRAQAMAKNEFIQLQPNGLLAFDNFLSTTAEKNVAESYVGCEQGHVGVLFEIEADGTCLTHNTPFASIQDYSYFLEENEVLFSMGSIFRIRSILKVENANDLYQVKLIITNKEDVELNELRESIKNEIGDHNGIFSLGSLMRIMGKYDKALHFFQLLLNSSSLEVNDPIRLSIIYNEIGVAYLGLKDYIKALEFYQKSLKLKRIHLKANDKNISVVLSNIGIAYGKQGMPDEALAYFKEAAEIDMNNAHDDNKSDRLRQAYNNEHMGCVYAEKGDYSRALHHFRMTQEIENDVLPPYHTNHVFTNKNIGAIFLQQLKYDEALIYFQKALAVQTRALSDTHPQVIQLHQYIGDTYEGQKNYTQALLFYTRTLKLATRSSYTDASFAAMINSRIADMHLELKQYQEALWFYRRSLDLRLNSLIEDEKEIAILYIRIGLSLYLLEDFKKSFENMEKGVQILSKTEPSDDDELRKYIMVTELIRKKA